MKRDWLDRGLTIVGGCCALGVLAILVLGEDSEINRTLIAALAAAGFLSIANAEDEEGSAAD